MKLEFIETINNIDQTQFENINNSQYPFLKYEFLSALEQSNSVCTETGWQINHLTAWDDKELVGFMPLYFKTHSYGEYVFDFQWANAYHQSGIKYYPKLLSAIPFTPCSGPRILLKPHRDNVVSDSMFEKIIEEAERINASSFHYLFPNKDSFPTIHSDKSDAKLLHRVGMQYHWFNQNYNNFDDFLNQCKAKPRKNIRRERRSFVDPSISIKMVEGSQIDESLWKQFYLFYCATYAKRSGNYGYLNEAFFQMIGKSMPSSIVMAVAEVDDQPIAISLFFKDEDTLYGRYWGCSQEIEFLHFELCYYRGIEYCIKNNLKRFDAGAQGEHKISRGFKPIQTSSYHWIKDLRFRDAISDFLAQETDFVLSSINKLSERLPFK
ncbi:MAG: GNAT family N-acetyltransferase [Gammaproteobacteria bacterium]|nr:MAG: GNAT family N-acetyltransferase [Gammaproteobacteria bacterium]